MPSSTVESTITGSSNDCTELTSDTPAAPTTTFNQDKAMLDFQPSVILEYCNAVRNAHTLTTQTQTFYHDNNASTTTDERQYYQEPDLDWEQHRQNWILEHSKIEDNNDPFEILTADSTDLQQEDQTLILNDFVRTIFYQSGADV
mmetsp:Transcript_22410/g.32137  ORF Transcript_22410/g.32137 Transcript_22410/m.32137 type:complete len:145 (+) Transcript_22410:111-545(+)